MFSDLLVCNSNHENRIPDMLTWKKMWRTKYLDESSSSQSISGKFLNVCDLTFLGLGSTLGVGVYVLPGEVSKAIAGPAIVISFLMAAVAALLAGLCFSEFGGRIPRAGSAYVYSYYCVGEFLAFIVGWLLILQYVMGAASVAKGISNYIDSITNNNLRRSFTSLAPMTCTYTSNYVDFLAFGLCILMSIALASGIKESVVINNILTLLNLIVIVIMIVSGIVKADPKNWSLHENLPYAAGDGGFAPFQLSGIIQGAAICFFAFIGFDYIATTGDEASNPQRSIPLAILSTFILSFLAYFGLYSVLNLMMPYHAHSTEAPWPNVFIALGWPGGRWIVTLGGILGMFASLIGAVFTLPRVIYAMAADGLIFQILGEVCQSTNTPVVGMFVAGTVTAVMAAIFNLKQLICLTSLGTLITYTIVAISVLMIRYEPECDDDYDQFGETSCPFIKLFLVLKQIIINYFNCKNDIPSATTKRIVVLNVSLFVIAAIALTGFLMNLQESCSSSSNLVPIWVTLALMMLFMISIAFQPSSSKCVQFRIPLVPLIPCLSIVFNIYLMMVLDRSTWIKFGIWMVIGFVPYLFWYLWKYYRGEVNEKSRYNVNRMNHIKLNTLICQIEMENRILLKGFANEAFVPDEERRSSVSERKSVPEERSSEINNNEGVSRVVVHVESVEREEHRVGRKASVTLKESLEPKGEDEGATKEEPEAKSEEEIARSEEQSEERGENMISRVLKGSIRIKLEKVLREHLSFIAYGLNSSSLEDGEREESSSKDQEASATADVRTLSKAEMKKKLQDLLRQGPQKSPSFRTKDQVPEAFKGDGTG